MFNSEQTVGIEDRIRRFSPLVVLEETNGRHVQDGARDL
jgi:hypothetical protein